MLQLIALLVALVIGYFTPRLNISINNLNKILFIIVVLILFIMGYEITSSGGEFIPKFKLISKTVVIVSIMLFLANFFIGNYLLKSLNARLHQSEHISHTNGLWKVFFSSFKYVLIIIVGLMAGVILKTPITFLNLFISGLLFILLFIIGYQIKVAGIPLKSVFLNKYGLLVSKVIIASSLLAGVLAALILNISVLHGLMLSSGFGWYTLSSVMGTSLVNQNFGACAFFIDFFRELIGIILIPSLGQKYPATLIGYCGAPAADFALPAIKQNLHPECVLLAISSGMLLSFVVPILISLFAKLMVML